MKRHYAMARPPFSKCSHAIQINCSQILIKINVFNRVIPQFPVLHARTVILFKWKALNFPLRKVIRVSHQKLQDRLSHPYFLKRKKEKKRAASPTSESSPKKIRSMPWLPINDVTPLILPYQARTYALDTHLSQHHLPSSWGRLG